MGTLQAMLVEEQAKLQEERQARAAAQAQELALQATAEAQKPAQHARVAANDVDLLRVQLDQVLAKTGKPLGAYGNLDLEQVAADI